MVEEPDYAMAPRGHHFDSGPFTLDLYRLLCMIVADKDIAGMTVSCRTILKSPTLDRLHDDYVRTELIRILTSSSTALRILFDQHDPREFADLKNKTAASCIRTGLSKKRQ